MSGGVVIIRQNRLMRRFADAGATTPEAARMPAELECQDGWVFRRMVSRGVFVSVEGDRFYMDRAAAREFVRQRRTRMLWVIGAATVLWLLWVIVFR